MIDDERMETRGRRAIGWGAGLAMVFSVLAAVWSLLSQLGTEIRADQPAAAFVVTYVLAGVAVLGFGGVLYGIYELARVSWREKHPAR